MLWFVSGQQIICRLYGNSRPAIVAIAKIPPRVTKNHWIWHFFVEEVQKYDCLYNKFSTEYWKQAQEKRLPESNWGKIWPEFRSGREKKFKKTQEQPTRDFYRSDSGREAVLTSWFAIALAELKTRRIFLIWRMARMMLSDPGPLDTFSAIAGGIWKPSIATIAGTIFSAIAAIAAIIWKPSIATIAGTIFQRLQQS